MANTKIYTIDLMKIISALMILAFHTNCILSVHILFLRHLFLAVLFLWFSFSYYLDFAYT